MCSNSSSLKIFKIVCRFLRLLDVVSQFGGTTKHGPIDGNLALFTISNFCCHETALGPFTNDVS